MIASIDRYLSLFPYYFYDSAYERLYHRMVHSLLVCMKGDAYAEDAGRTGRADEVFITDRHIYIMELKADGAAEEALEQIKSRHYADKYIQRARDKGRDIILLGISFSSETRSIAEYRYERLAI